MALLSQGNGGSQAANSSTYYEHLQRLWSSVCMSIDTIRCAIVVCTIDWSVVADNKLPADAIEVSHDVDASQIFCCLVDIVRDLKHVPIVIDRSYVVNIFQDWLTHAHSDHNKFYTTYLIR